MVMGTQAPSVYQQVIEKTKGIMSRTQELARNIEKKLNVDKLGYDGVGAYKYNLVQHLLCKLVLTLSLKIKPYSVTIQTKATEKFIHVAPFIMLLARRD